MDDWTRAEPLLVAGDATVCLEVNGHGSHAVEMCWMSPSEDGEKAAKRDGGNNDAASATPCLLLNIGGVLVLRSADGRSAPLTDIQGAVERFAVLQVGWAMLLAVQRVGSNLLTIHRLHAPGGSGTISAPMFDSFDAYDAGVIKGLVWSPEVRVLAVVGTAKALICEIGGAAELTFRPVTWVNVAATGGAWADCGRELLLWTATSLHRLTFCAPPEEPYQSPHMSTPKEIVLGLLGRRIRFVQPVCGPYGASAHAVVVLDADTSIYTPANAGLIDYSALDRRAEGREGFASSPLEQLLNLPKPAPPNTCSTLLLLKIDEQGAHEVCEEKLPAGFSPSCSAACSASTLVLASDACDAILAYEVSAAPDTGAKLSPVPSPGSATTAAWHARSAFPPTPTRAREVQRRARGNGTISASEGGGGDHQGDTPPAYMRLPGRKRCHDIVYTPPLPVSQYGTVEGEEEGNSKAMRTSDKSGGGCDGAAARCGWPVLLLLLFPPPAAEDVVFISPAPPSRAVEIHTAPVPLARGKPNSPPPRETSEVRKETYRRSTRGVAGGSAEDVGTQGPPAVEKTQLKSLLLGFAMREEEAGIDHERANAVWEEEMAVAEEVRAVRAQPVLPPTTADPAAHSRGPVHLGEEPPVAEPMTGTRSPTATEATPPPPLLLRGLAAGGEEALAKAATARWPLISEVPSPSDAGRERSSGGRDLAGGGRTVGHGVTVHQDEEPRSHDHSRNHNDHQLHHHHHHHHHHYRGSGTSAGGVDREMQNQREEAAGSGPVTQRDLAAFAEQMQAMVGRAMGEMQACVAASEARIMTRINDMQRRNT